MALLDQIEADKAAVAAAQDSLNQANAKLAADQAQLDALEPHVSLWQEVENYAAAIGGDFESALKGFAARGKALVGL